METHHNEELSDDILPPKRQNRTKPKFKEQCIIHHPTVKYQDEDHLIEPKDLASWLALLDAAKLKCHEPILSINKQFDDEDFPQILYHRKCRSLFTMKRDLESLKRKADESPHNIASSSSSSGTSKRSSRKSSSESRVYEEICMFCNKKAKFRKSSRTREHLTKAEQLRADKTLREWAIKKKDDRILALTSRDIVAAEAHYHRTCYRDYTRSREKVEEDRGLSDNEEDAEFELYHRIEKDAYADLFKYIRIDIIPKKEITSIIALTRKLESFMLARDVKLMKYSTRKHISRQLKSEFGDSVHIFPDDSGKLLMVPDNITLKEVVIENQTLHKELKVWKGKATDINKIIDTTSSQIRSVIKEDMTPTPWPYHPYDTNECDNVSIPYSLERFLFGLLSGEPDSKMHSHRVNTLVQSFSQDMIYAVTRGQHKPPKHILLPNAVKSLTGNVELIRILNTFGHGVSYSQLEENDTALCLQKLAAGFNERVVLPRAIVPNVFANLAYDNIDRLEETLSGKGTSHRVNGIVVQTKVFGPHLPRVELPPIEKLKQRSINIEHQELETYIAGARVGPQPVATKQNHDQQAKEAAQVATNKNLLWIVARQSCSEKQTVPSWTGFNIRTRDQQSIAEDVVGYLPTINAPATELTTVFEILKQSEDIRQELSLETIVVVMDQALYAKAAEIVWKHKARFSNILLRMGTFHTIMNALAIIGKRFRDAGLKDICIETGIVAEGSINGVVDGKHYNRAVRIHKYIYEALMRLAWTEFVQWVDDKHQDRSADINSFLEQVQDMVEDIDQQAFDSLLQSPILAELIIMWTDFLEYLHRNNGDLSSYWMSYLDIVDQVLLGLLRASREGNWDLHLSSIRTMIPWCFAYDKINYARYLSVYYAQMTNLPENNPDVYDAFKEGRFSVQLSSKNPFGRIPVDQTTEVTVNKDTQTHGGTTGFSLKPGAIRRYYITAEYRSAFMGKLRHMVHGNISKLHHADLQPLRIQKDDDRVSAVVNLIEGWVNPFAEKQDLKSISTAKAAPTEVVSDLMKAYEIGEQSYITFKEERLDKDPPTKTFHDPLKTNRLKTFTDICKKKVVKTSGKEIILKADRSLFGRIIVMAQGRHLQMENVLAHPLGPLPWSLSTPDGLLRKTNKATLAATLQKNVTVADTVPGNSASVVDGMSLVQRVKGDEATFGDIASTVLTMALNEGRHSTRIDVVFDTYKENSIKNNERSLRGSDTGHQLHGITGTQIVRQWREFLTHVNNKTNLIAFIVNEWRKVHMREKLQDKVLYATVDNKCYKITHQDSEEVPTLQCEQEEADGRLLLHAAHAAHDGYPSVIICSEDTDVFIMCLAFHDKMSSKLYQKCGTKTKTRIVDISKVAATVGIIVCRALIGLHAFTGCDTTSAFAGKGKTSALKLLISNTDVCDTFIELGQQWDLPLQLMNKLEAFTCLLYAPKSSSTNINDLRYHLFCVKKGEIESHKLPPCRDCLSKHAERANYQAGIWRRCLKQDPQVPAPDGRGWKVEVEDGVEQLVVDWMDGQPAPEAILELLACNCTRTCALPRCVCMANGLKCTDMCRLQNCENRSPESDDEEFTEDDENDEVHSDSDY